MDDFLPLLPLIAIGGIAGLSTARLEKYHVGAIGNEFIRTPLEKFLIAGRALVFYPSKLLVPTDLTFIYPRWQIDTAEVAAYFYLVAAIAVLISLWVLRGRTGKGPLAAALFYFVMIFPALGFFNVFFMRYSYVQDHFQYLASLGPIALFAATVAAGAGKAAAHLDVRDQGNHRKMTVLFRRMLRPAIGIALLATLGLLTWKQSHAYRDVETLWRDTIDKNPAAYIAHFNLAHLLAGRGLNDEAYRHYTEVIRLQPDSFQSLANRAGILAVQGKIDQARADYLTAWRIARDKKDSTAMAIIERYLADLPPRSAN